MKKMSTSRVSEEKTPLSSAAGAVGSSHGSALSRQMTGVDSCVSPTSLALALIPLLDEWVVMMVSKASSRSSSLWYLARI